MIEFDIRRFFDTVPLDKVVKAVEAHTDAGWAVLYVKRWLAAGLRLPDGSTTERSQGTPQSSAVSPVLANLLLHYAFDAWMARERPDCPFERYADDAVIHCRTLAQAREVLAALRSRMAEVGLELHPDKTRIVYCKDSNRRENFPEIEFAFLGFIRGWMAYYGRFYRSALYPLFDRINYRLMRWIYRRQAGVPPHDRRLCSAAPVLRALDLASTGRRGDQDDKSRISREVYLRFCGSPGVKSPWAT